MNEEKENKLEKLILEDGIIIVGTGERIKVFKEKYLEEIKEVSKEIGYKGINKSYTQIILLGGGIDRDLGLEYLNKLESKVGVILMGEDDKPVLANKRERGLKIDELDIKELEVGDVHKEPQKYYIKKERIDKNFNNKYKLKILKSQINYKKKF